MPVTVKPPSGPPARPKNCPPSSEIDQLLNSASSYLAEHPGTGVAGQFLNQLTGSHGVDEIKDKLLNALVSLPAGCTNPQQKVRMREITTSAQTTAHSEQDVYQAGILGFLTKLLQPETYIRAAELIIGLVLILMGIKQLAAMFNVSIPMPGVAGLLKK